MPSLSEVQIQKLNAVEAKKRDLRAKLARVKGQLDASAALSRFVARVNQDTQIQRDEINKDLNELEASGETGITDGWGKFTSVDLSAKPERLSGANAGLDWLAANVTGTQTDFAAAVQQGLLAGATAAGRSFRLHSSAGLVETWMRAAAAQGLATDWPSFRAALLDAVDRETALALLE